MTEQDRDALQQELERWVRTLRENPDSSMASALLNRIAWLQRKLEEFDEH